VSEFVAQQQAPRPVARPAIAQRGEAAPIGWSAKRSAKPAARKRRVSGVFRELGIGIGVGPCGDSGES
jgi:hypothetical protein